MSQLALALPRRPLVLWPDDVDSVRSSPYGEHSPLFSLPLLSGWEPLEDCERDTDPSMVCHWLHPDGQALIAGIVRWVPAGKLRGWWVLCYGLRTPSPLPKWYGDMSKAWPCLRIRKPAPGRAKAITMAEGWLAAWSDYI